MKKKILLIEDNIEKNFRHINNLEEKYEVIRAISVNAVFNRLESIAEFDLIILDIMMASGPYTDEETDEGTETGWVLYNKELKHLKKKIIVWTRNDKILEKTWDNPPVVEIMLKGDNDLSLVEAVKKHIGE